MTLRKYAGETKVKTRSDRTVSLLGAKSLEGNKWVRIKYRGKAAWEPYNRFAADKTAARKSLVSKGVAIIDEKDWTDIVNAIANIKRFRRWNIIERPGWTAGHFALRDGTVLSPDGAGEVVVGFEPDRSGPMHQGTFEAWRDMVAAPLVDQRIPSFMLMAAFAAPLLRFSDIEENFGFEICGEGATGKSSCQRVAASVFGPVAASLISFHATMAGLEREMAAHADRCMLIDEANLFGMGEGERARSQKFQDLAFQLAMGKPKIRFDGAEPSMKRFVFLTSSNRPFHELLANSHGDIAEAVLDRYMTIKIPRENTLGIFDSVPEGFTNTGQLINHLQSAVRQEYGTALPQFLKRLVDRREQSEEKLREQITKKVAKFKAAVGISGDHRFDARVANAFGIVFAAGDLARYFGILPSKLDCLETAVHCYRNYRRSVPHRAPLKDRLLFIADRPETLSIDRKKLPQLTDDQVKALGAFIRPGVGGRPELLLTPASRNQFFPDWKAIKSTDEFSKLIIIDSDRKTTKRQIRANAGSEPMTCFLLPDRPKGGS